MAAIDLEIDMDIRPLAVGDPLYAMGFRFECVREVTRFVGRTKARLQEHVDRVLANRKRGGWAVDAKWTTVESHASYEG